MIMSRETSEIKTFKQFVSSIDSDANVSRQHISLITTALSAGIGASWNFILNTSHLSGRIPLLNKSETAKEDMVACDCTIAVGYLGADELGEYNSVSQV